MPRSRFEAEPLSFGSRAILIDGVWSLEDLYKFPRAYEQVYFTLEALVPSDDEEVNERITRAFNAYPWRGGYSAVSFYNQLKWTTPPRARPRVTSIQYASPGWIELWLKLPIALQLASIVTSVAASIGACNKVYNQIHTDLQKRNLLRIEVERKRLELSRDELKLISESATTMAKLLGLRSVKDIHRRTDDELISLKIILSFYRRIRLLSEYQNNGKADFKQQIDDENR